MDLILEYMFAASTVAVGWSGYVVRFLNDMNIVIPKQFTEAPFTHAIPPGTEWWNIWRLMGPEGWSGTGQCSACPP